MISHFPPNLKGYFSLPSALNLMGLNLDGITKGLGIGGGGFGGGRVWPVFSVPSPFAEGFALIIFVGGAFLGAVELSNGSIFVGADGLWNGAP